MSDDLAPGDVRVWLHRPVSAGESATRSLLGLLDRVEHAHRAAFAFDRDRDLYTTAHALARLALAEVTGTTPVTTSVLTERFRRPRVTGRSDLDISLSHTDGLVAVAIARQGRCGVDVEPLDVRHAAATWALTPAERDALATMRDRRAAAWARYWTLKEAISKVSGQGLTMPFCEVELSPPWGSPRIVAGHGVIDVPDQRPERWRLAHRLVGDAPWAASVALLVDEGLDPQEPTWSWTELTPVDRRGSSEARTGSRAHGTSAVGTSRIGE